MPTQLERAVTRLVEGRRGTKVVVRLTKEGILFREYRRRRWYGPLDYGALLIDSVRRTLDAERRSKRRK